MEFIIHIYYTEDSAELQDIIIHAVDFSDAIDLFFDKHPDANIAYTEMPDDFFEDEDIDFDEDDLEMGFDPYEGGYTYDC